MMIEDMSKLMRPEVFLFALSMERKLREYDAERGVDGWHKCSKDWLFERLEDEADELWIALDSRKPFYRECHDVGNFAMMVAYHDLPASVDVCIENEIKYLLKT